jgi:hypothetical protein
MDVICDAHFVDMISAHGVANKQEAPHTFIGLRDFGDSDRRRSAIRQTNKAIESDAARI